MVSKNNGGLLAKVNLRREVAFLIGLNCQLSFNSRLVVYPLNLNNLN
jgi:hypothetical protein